MQLTSLALPAGPDEGKAPRSRFHCNICCLAAPLLTLSATHKHCIPDQ